jgi:hypothetical protein
MGDLLGIKRVWGRRTRQKGLYARIRDGGWTVKKKGTGKGATFRR